MDQLRSAPRNNNAMATVLYHKLILGRQPSYSSKIFLGGVPWDITENALIQVNLHIALLKYIGVKNVLESSFVL